MVEIAVTIIIGQRCLKAQWTGQGDSKIKLIINNETKNDLNIVTKTFKPSVSKVYLMLPLQENYNYNKCFPMIIIENYLCHHHNPKF